MTDFITRPNVRARVEEFLEEGWSILFYRNTPDGVTHTVVLAPPGTAAEEGFCGAGPTWDDAADAALDAMEDATD